jgi:uncharacterized protein YdcH (DUF465 family)
MTISEVRELLLHSDAEYQKLAAEHAKYAVELEQLTRSLYHNAEDLQLESELKKLKLRLKDEMERRVAQFRPGS